MTTVQLRDVKYYRVPMRTRFPFRYGIASLTELPHLFVRATVLIDGTSSVGMSADGLPPKWFTKNPDTSFEEDDLPQMLRSIRAAARTAMTIGQQDSVFEWWWKLYDLQGQWAEREDVAPLLASFGVSLIERAVLDAFCRATETPLHQVVRDNRLAIRFGVIDKNLADAAPRSFVTKKPLEALTVRHTIGLADPLTDGEIRLEDRLNDGLPHSLEASIQRYGLTHFKIKLLGDLPADQERLREAAGIIQREAGPEARFTLDGNENYHDVRVFQEHWNVHRSDPPLRDFFERCLLFVEQPLHRRVALKTHLQLDDKAWIHPPQIIIDESDAKLASFPAALSFGYQGTSHKNCKGVLKGLLNAARIVDWWRRDVAAFLSAEDLANVGPVALLQDLAVVAMLGVEHAERNGHHFFAGLSMFPESEQERVLRNHPDLYERSSAGFATLKIRSGQISLGSVNAAPFGCAEHPDAALFDEWHFE